jgi:hypothetical protein
MDQPTEPPRIAFEGKEFQQPAQSLQAQTPKIVQWVMTYSGGSVKNEKQAQYVLIGFVVVALIVTFISLSGSGESKAKLEAPPGQEIIYPENAPPQLRVSF